MWTIYKKLNVSPNSYPLVIPIKQYSSDFVLKIKLYSTDGDLDIEAGATTKIRGTKRDGNGFELTGTRIGNTCTFSGTKAQMQQMTAAHGRCVFEIVVEKNTKELITANFYLEVQRAAMDAGTVTSESIIEEFADFQSKITAAQAAVTAAQAQADRAEASAESIDFGIDSTPTQNSTNAITSGAVYNVQQTIPTIDNTLTQAGKAADAKKTRDEISALKEDLDSIFQTPEETTADFYICDASGNVIAEFADGHVKTKNFDSSDINLTTDATPTEGSTNPVQSGGVYSALQNIAIETDATPTENSTNAVQSGGVYDAIAEVEAGIPDTSKIAETKSSTATGVDIDFADPSGNVVLRIADGHIQTANFDSSTVSESIAAKINTQQSVSDAGKALVVGDDGNVAPANLLGTRLAVDSLATFAQGNVNSSTGAYQSSYSYRVATPDIFTLSEDIAVTVADGFRMYVTYFSDGTRTSSGWQTGTFTLASGSELRLMIARTTEDTSESADVETFCSKVTYITTNGLEYALEQIEDLQKANANITYGMTWDWWISANSVDTWGNVYIGYIDSDGYAGVLRRQPDGTMQYKRLEESNNNDDHNGMATHVLSDGRILVIGAHGHASDNHVICWRSVNPYSIEEMEDLSFDVEQETGWEYRLTYSQVFEYSGNLYNFFRCTAKDTVNSTSDTGIGCMVSADDGDSWTLYKAIYAGDPYFSYAQATDDSKYLKFIRAKNPSSGVSSGTYFYGGYIDLSAMTVYNLEGTEIGTFQTWGGAMETDGVATDSDMTVLTGQAVDGKKGRLFWCGKTELADTVFLYAQAVDTEDSDFTYRIYDNGTITDIGTSGVAFGNTSYISGMCFGKDTGTIYYAKATTDEADGDHELHKVKIANNAVSSDEIIAETSICMIRPLFLGNGEVATVVGHYNDQNGDGTYNGSFTAWELKPMFTRA